MGKAVLRAVFRRAGWALTLGACSLGAVQAQDAGQYPSLLAPQALSKNKNKKSKVPEKPPLRATLPPTLTIPVDPLGFAAPGPFYLGMRNSLVSLDFLDESHLLFTFRVPGLMHRDPKSQDGSDERQVRALVLSLPQGSVEAETVWTLHDRSQYLYMLDGGKFIIRDRNNLQMGDASLQLKPWLQFPGPVLWVQVDPTHQYVISGSDEPRTKEAPAEGTDSSESGDEASPSEDVPDLVVRILRRDDGKIILVSRVRQPVRIPVSGDGYLEPLRSKAEAWMLNFHHFDGGTHIVGMVNSTCTPKIDFMSAKSFLLTGCTGDGDAQLTAMNLAGRRLWNYPNVGQSVWPLLIMAPNGLRLAREVLMTTHEVNASNPLGTDDIKGQDVAVFDTATGKLVLRAQASPVLDAGGNVAISPSGNRVAVLMEGGIQVFDLPPAATVPDQPAGPANR